MDERERILGCAEICFAKGGYRGTTIRDIAQEAGINPATLYRFFPGKRALFDALGRPELDFQDPQRAAQEDRIRKAALKVFSKNGLRASTMEDIGEAAGLTKGGLYLYYPSKEALFQSVLDNPPVLRWVEPVLEQIKRDKILSLENCLEELAAAYLAAFDNEDTVSLMRIILAEGMHDPQIARTFVDRIVLHSAQRIGLALHDRLPIGISRRVEFYRLFFGALFSWVLSDRIMPGADKQLLKSDAQRELARQAARIFVQGIYNVDGGSV